MKKYCNVVNYDKREIVSAWSMGDDVARARSFYIDSLMIPALEHSRWAGDRIGVVCDSDPECAESVDVTEEVAEQLGSPFMYLLRTPLMEKLDAVSKLNR